MTPDPYCLHCPTNLTWRWFFQSDSSIYLLWIPLAALGVLILNEWSRKRPRQTLSTFGFFFAAMLMVLVPLVAEMRGAMRW